MMPDRYPLGFDLEQHRLLRILYDDLVPPLNFIAVRPGLHGIVDRLFAQLGRLPDRRDLRIHRIESRNAGYLAITTSGSATGAGEIVAEAEDAARRTCEHCGQPARIVVKVGLESWMSNPDLELGDRLLCLDCAGAFRREIV